MRTHMDAITLLIAALATARLTRLVTTDRIFHAPRRWALLRLDPDGLWAYLLVCNWCVSVYVGTAMAAGLWLSGAVPGALVVPLGLAFSHVAGWTSGREDG